jgi:serine/threonine-protein kinase
MSSGSGTADGKPGSTDSIAGWLATIDAATVATLHAAPADTIIPTAYRHSTGGARALALFEELANRPAAGGEPLELGEVLGEGGMGVIHAAEQTTLGRPVAVKTLKPARRSRDAAIDLLREAWVTGRLEHPNIVPVHHVGLDEDGQPLIVLKRIEGESWYELMNDADAVAARFAATDLLAWNIGILIQVLNALRFAHSRGIIHRDLKPGNVMIGAFGEVYLLDWGIAVSLVDDGSGRLPLASMATEMAGTPCYMAPEMLGRGGPPLSERTDVYLAGAVLHEIVGGSPPHRGTTAYEVIASVIASEPSLPATVPAELARICARAMHASPDARFASAEELQQALRGYLERRGSERLAERAQVRLDELLVALATSDGDAAGRREQIYRLFGACRFGFHEALVAWRDNTDARAGLHRAIVAVAEFELVDDPRAAVALLGELDEPPAELLARARAAAAAAASRHDQLERLDRLHDAAIGTRTRFFLTVVMGMIFTISPLIVALNPTAGPSTHRDLVMWSVGLLGVMIGFGVWARESLRKTLLNRRVFAAGLFLFISQGILMLGAPAMGLTILQSKQLMLFLWFALAGMLAIGIDRRMYPIAIGYAVAFGVAVARPAWMMFAMSASNFVFLVTSAWHWRPATFRPTSEEIARYQRE